MNTLNDCYQVVERTLEEAWIEGFLPDEEKAMKYGFPKQADLSDEEKEELAVFVTETVIDMEGRLIESGYILVDPLRSVFLKASLHFMYNVVLAGILWERYVRDR